MTQKELLENLTDEIGKLRKEVKELRDAKQWEQVRFIPQPYPVYVPQYPCYPSIPSYPWWGIGTVIIGNTPPTGAATWTTAEIKFDSSANEANYQLKSGAPQA